MIATPSIYALEDLAVTVPGTFIGDWIEDLEGLEELTVQARLAYGSGGTTIVCFVQTSLDQGETAIDIACIAFATAAKTAVLNFSGATPVLSQVTPSDGALANNTAIDGILGDRIRTKVVVTGTYTNSTVLTVRGHAR